MIENITNMENGKKYAILSGVFYLGGVITRIFYSIFFLYLWNLWNFWDFIDIGVFVGMSVVSIKRNSEAVMLVAASRVILYIIRGLICFISVGIFPLDDVLLALPYILLALPYILLIIVLISIKRNIVNRDLCLIAAISSVVIYVVIQFMMILSGDISLHIIVEGVALFFTYLWLIEGIPHTEKNQGNNSAFGGADQIKIYKDLLDSGGITQEEFDRKKKEVLDI